MLLNTLKKITSCILKELNFTLIFETNLLNIVEDYFASVLTQDVAQTTDIHSLTSSLNRNATRGMRHTSTAL
jgi:hypothetical protein